MAREGTTLFLLNPAVGLCSPVGVKVFLRKSEACDSPEVETHPLRDVAEATRVPTMSRA